MDDRFTVSAIRLDVPHADRSTRNEWDLPTCPYCGRILHRNRYGRRSVVCADCADLPALEPLDDRYLLTETPPHA